MADPQKPDLAALIAAGPGGGGDDAASVKYLGVPQGYRAFPGAGQGDAGNIVTNTVGVAPRYQDGEQYAPGGGSPEDIARLQQRLDHSGLFQKGEKYRLGVWDDTSTDAYTRLLYFANQQGYDAQRALDVIGTLTPEEYDNLYGKGAWAKSSSGGMKSVSGPGAAGDVTPGVINQRMSEDDLRYLAQRTARKSLGRALSDDELNTFSGAYSQMINAAGQREAAARATAAGGQNATFNAATSPDVFAEQEAQRLDPTAFEARRQVGALRSIGGMLGELGKS